MMLQMELDEIGRGEWEEHTAPRRLHKTVILQHPGELIVRADAYVSYYTAFYSVKFGVSYDLVSWVRNRPFKLKHADPQFVFPIGTSLRRRCQFLILAKLILDMQMASDLQDYRTCEAVLRHGNDEAGRTNRELVTRIASVFSDFGNLRSL